MISKCLEIGIKVWMITGDKLETAENIGLMAGILNPEMEIFYIDEMDIS
jgi:phospholipid-translocating ATPase